MINRTNLHPLDTRTHQEQEDDIINLNVIQDVLEEDISAYALLNPENLYDEENRQIIRKLEFSRGLKTHLIVIAPDGFIRHISIKFPSILLQEIHNALLGIEILYDDTSSIPSPISSNVNTTIQPPTGRSATA
jgi:Ni,Fe-hydrogenase III large subunit